jgi:hypothetical protein
MAAFSLRSGLQALALTALVAIATPASAWEILAKLTRDNNGTAGPSKLAGTTRPNKSTAVDVSFSTNFPDEVVPPGWPATGSEVSGSASVDLPTGSLHGAAHAVAGAPNWNHSMVFDTKLTEAVRLTIDTSSPSFAAWIAGTLEITLIGHAHGSATATGPAHSELNYYFNVNGLNANASTHSDCVSYATSCGGVWGGFNLTSPTRQTATGGVGGVEISTRVLVPLNGTLNVVTQLSGSAFAFSTLAEGVGIADANAAHTGWVTIELPPGVTFTSQSRAFLTSPIPEPATWALWLTSLGALVLRRRYVGAGRVA